MLPKYHFIIGAVFSIIIFILNPSIDFWFYIFIFITSWAIDFDHYLWYIFNKKSWNLEKAYNFFKFHPTKNKSKYERRKYKLENNEILILHCVEPAIVIFIALFFINPLFAYGFLIGFLIHLIVDLVDGLNFPERYSLLIFWIMKKHN